MEFDNNPLNYEQIDDILYKIALKLSSVPCLPLNYFEEKKKFYMYEYYNPVFRYEKASINLKMIKEILLKLNIPASELGKLFNTKRKELFTIIEMMESIGTTKLTEISKSLYGVPDKNLVDKAKKLISTHDAPEKVYLSSQQVKIRLEHAIKKYGFDWEVEERDMAAKACISTHDKKLYLKKDTFFTSKFLKRLVVHEIGTHILRYENGKNQPYKVLSLGLTNYLSTEEGLAVVNEEMHNCLTQSTLKTYAARVIAVDKALKCTFRETYNYLVPYIGKDNAFDITLRVKRGLGNTMWAGAFTKDYLYLKGYFDVKQYLENGGNMMHLYYGKIGISDLQNITQIKGLINPLFFSTMKYYTDYIRYKRIERE